ncbi:aminopeptidase N-like [Planococcus citri]|uniref:aminopeptidase N-like n=1 Tax=Planococcus citri TaxID=170843 RepID=UPI0031F813F8
MRALKNFELLSIVAIFSIVIVVGASSPFRANFQHLSSDIHESTDVYRLPNQVIPVSYELKMAPDLKRFIFAGKVDINVQVQFTTDRIVLHSKGLQIQNVMVKETKKCFSNATIAIPVTYKLDEKNEILIIQKKKKTSDKFKSNTKYKVSIKFNGRLESDPRGFYRTSYKMDNQTRWLVTTQFEETYARRAFPCFDEPRFRTPFTIHIARPKNHIAISNMPSETDYLLPADSMSNGLGYEKFQPTPPMPTYIVAFMVSDFKLLIDQNQDRRIRVIARPNAVKKGRYALEQANKLLTFLEGYLGIPYTLPKLDIVAVPNHTSGMENWGMTVYDENFVILDGNGSEDQKIDISEIISHEFAHLWFGDLVTPAWYDYTWLKEGFATYFQYFATAAIGPPTWNREEIFVVETTQMIFLEETSFKYALTRPVRTFQGIHGSFDDISYRKGAILIRMFELMFSSSTFQNALRRFLDDGRRNHNGVAVPKNLFDAFDKQVEFDSLSHLPPHVYASDIMRTWTENIGYPLINVTRSYKRGTAVILQTPYPLKVPSDDSSRDQKWIVPLTFTTESQQQFSNVQPNYWSFADEPTTLTGFNNSEWILFNLKRSGYYRVNYDSKNWQLLINQLMKNHKKIHVLNRAQLIDDVFTLATDRLINCKIAGRLIKYLQNETSVIPWYPASVWLLKLISSKKTDPESQKILKKQLKKFLKKPLKIIGCASTTDDKITRTGKQVFSILLKQVGINKCARKLFQIYQKNYNNLNKIPQNLKCAVFCNALRYSDEPRKIYEHLWHHYQISNEMYEKKQILESIFSCTNDEEVIISILSKTIDPEIEEISQHDISFIFKKFPSEIPTVTATIKFVDEKVSSLSNLDENCINFLRTLLISIDSKIQTEEQLNMIKSLEIKFESLEQQKYVEYVKLVKNLRTNAEKKIIFKELLPNRCLLLNKTSETSAIRGTISNNLF